MDENGHTALHYASRNGRVEVMQMLIEAGAEVNTAGTSATLMFPIHWACSTGMVKAVHLLLSHDAALEQTDSNGATPLIMACQNGHAGLAIYLIKRGADVNKRDKVALRIARRSWLCSADRVVCTSGGRYGTILGRLPWIGGAHNASGCTR